MNLFSLPTVKIRRTPKNFNRRTRDWQNLLTSSATVFNTICFGGVGGEEDGDKAALVQARIQNTQARTRLLEVQAELAVLRAQELGNKVTQAEQRAEKLELELLKLRHDLKARGIIKSDEFAEPSY